MYHQVTYRDPESAKRACEDPNPMIDGRRANCNIASLGRPRPSPQGFFFVFFMIFIIIENVMTCIPFCLNEIYEPHK